MADIEQGFKGSFKAQDVEDSQSSKDSIEVGQEHLAGVTPPHESFEGYHRFDPTATWTPKEERKLVWKTDLMLLSWICFMFFGLQLDRGNLSNALTDHLLADLGMTTDDYNNGSTIQLVCFLAAEFPVQLLIKRYGFKRVLPTMMLGWSLVSWTQSWMTSRAGFYVTRALIGAFEGGFIPGTILFATYFYKTKELSVRLAFFWSTLNVARIVSSLLAAGILQMRGVQGKSGWFWLFLIDGLLTFLIGLVSLFYLPTSPTNTKSVLVPRPWYTEREEVIMINRLLRDDPSKGLTHINERATLRDILSAWKDPSMWGLYFIGLVAYIPQSPIQSYLSLTLTRLGFDTFDANMLSIPSAALQIILMLAVSKSSDIFGERTFHCFFGEFWSLPLLIALLKLPDHGYNWPRFTISTMISGYPYFHPIVSAWISENTFDVKKRAITAATYNVIVQVGSIISSREWFLHPPPLLLEIYRSSDSPYYYTGNKVLISLCVLSLVVFVAQRELLRYLNRQKERKWQAMSPEERVLYQSDKEAREKEGNKRLDFRFKY
ncbi:MFS general substrate transporter [Aspergillus sclerotioniger CBS 115572]|uniref:MFS general substrate transporter n=1 Tax=Aspergillus sclerotioniger CBS 115572 TaxID=1450535 RepID=A0A317X9J8_9EURO|nr:MFS general substrate transporter [Aspergillus sclerotioniger CBS 115572]PWY95256.1 MFS general substrate transporter [Aspergillus sclerotioniger CBS 115572]